MVLDQTTSTQQSQQRGSYQSTNSVTSQEACVQQVVKADHVLLKMSVPNTDVGLIIGKNLSKIRVVLISKSHNMVTLIIHLYKQYQSLIHMEKGRNWQNN